MNQQLRVNPIACTGHGLCAELLPERVILDEWGYPVVSPEPIPTQLRKAARRAVTDCPALALLLTSIQQPGKRSGDGSGDQAPRPLTRARPRPGSRYGPVTGWRSRRPEVPGA